MTPTGVMELATAPAAFRRDTVMGHELVLDHEMRRGESEKTVGTPETEMVLTATFSAGAWTVTQPEELLAAPLSEDVSVTRNLGADPMAVHAAASREKDVAA